MDSPLMVRPSGMERLVQVLGTGADNLDSVLDDLEAQVERLIDSWSGDAQLAYYHTQSQWTRDITELKDILGDMRDAVDEIGQDYAQTDGKIAATFNF